VSVLRPDGLHTFTALPPLVFVSTWEPCLRWESSCSRRCVGRLGKSTCSRLDEAQAAVSQWRECHCVSKNSLCVQVPRSEQQLPSPATVDEHSQECSSDNRRASFDETVGVELQPENPPRGTSASDESGPAGTAGKQAAARDHVDPAERTSVQLVDKSRTQLDDTAATQLADVQLRTAGASEDGVEHIAGATSDARASLHGQDSATEGLTIVAQVSLNSRHSWCTSTGFNRATRVC